MPPIPLHKWARVFIVETAVAAFDNGYHMHSQHAHALCNRSTIRILEVIIALG